MQNGKSVGSVVSASKGACGSQVRYQNISTRPVLVWSGNLRAEHPEHSFELAPGEVKCLPKGVATEVRIQVGEIVMVEADLIAYDPLATLGILPPQLVGTMLAEALILVEDNTLILEATPDHKVTPDGTV